MSTSVPHPTLSTEESRRVAEEFLDEVLHYDHRFCSNCYRQIREVEMPDVLTGGKMPPECAIGFAYPTQHTMPGIGVDHSKGQSQSTRSVPIFVQRQICDCGATHHRTVSRPVSKDTLLEYTKNLSETVDSLREEYLAGSDADVVKARKWDHSTDALLYAVGELKSRPKLQFQDQKILKRGLAVAMRNAD